MLNNKLYKLVKILLKYETTIKHLFKTIITHVLYYLIWNQMKLKSKYKNGLNLEMNKKKS